MEALAARMTPESERESESVVVAAELTFADVYRDHFAFVWRSARALGASPAALDDVVQEIFVIVHQRLSTFEGRSKVRTWLSGIVLNVVRHHRRSLVRKSPHELSHAEVEDPDGLATSTRDPYQAAAISEETRLVERILSTLDDDQREVLVLTEFEELTVPEIAEALGLKLNTAYSRLRLARERFEASLARHRARDQRFDGRGRP